MSETEVDEPSGAAGDHPLDVIFRPRGVAVVGVSTQPDGDGRMGGNFLNAILEQGYEHEHALYAVNPKMTEVRGVPCYPSILECPDPLDHVISQIPAPGVPELVEHCIQRGVRSLHFFTAGLSETGDETLIRQERALVERARQAGMRLIGPNCMGLYVPGVGLAFNSNSPIEQGNVFMLSQSGANASAIIEGLGSRGLRFSKGVSYGNAADLKSHDFLDYALHDPQTELVVAYIEGPRDGRAFFEALKRVAKVKPTIVLKGGISEDGARAAQSHTGSLAGSIEVFDALCRQAGAMRVRTLDDLIDLAVAATSELRHVRGKRVTLVGAGGGYAVLSSDQIAMQGLQVPWLPESVQNDLHEFIPIAGTSVRNPVDANFGRDHPMDFNSDAELTRKSFELIANSPTTDLIFTTVGTRWHPGQDDSPAGHSRRLALAADALASISQASDVPIALVLREGNLGDAGNPAHERGIAVFPTLERAARAVATLLEWRKRREGLPELF
jgi:acyl-CoA synthetase (NDP forming)